MRKGYRVVSFLGAMVFLSLYLVGEEVKRVSLMKERKEEVKWVREVLNGGIYKNGVGYGFNEVESPFGVDMVGVKKRIVTDEIQHGEGDEEYVIRQLRPTGVIEKGSDHYLVFGQNLVKAGENVEAYYHGKRYEVRVESVTREKFILILNGRQFERKIETAKSIE